MNKFALSLIALAALSTASFAAGNRSWDLQDREYYTTQGYVTEAGSTAIVEESPLAVSGTVSNFERLQQNMMKNELSSH